MVRQHRLDRLITIAIYVMLTIAIIQGAWIGYSFWIKPKVDAASLPPNVTDMRGEALPSLASLIPVDAYSVETELQAPTTIVAFLLTTCPACNNAKPTLEALKQENPATLGFIGIFAESAEVVHNYQASYPRFLDTDRVVFDMLGAVSVPTILVAREGEIVYHSVGWSPEVGKRLEAFVKEGR